MTKKEIGYLGEKIAAKYLSKHKCKIIATNYYSRYGEIDIIATTAEYILFCEVKTRASDKFGRPAQAVDFRKRRKLFMTAHDYIAKHPTNLQPRFDVLEVIGNSVNHIENAFIMEDANGVF